MKRMPLFALAASLLLFAACGGGSGNSPSSVPPAQPSGAMSFRIDLSTLVSAAPASARGASPAADPSITAVDISLTRDGYDPIVRALAVENGIASGRVDNLAVGYWHVQADAYDNGALIYTGSTDAEVAAGLTVQCTILFDPAPPQAGLTGSISITVGMNPVPGYTVFNQAVNEILLDRAAGKFYIYDASALKIGVYHADNLVRIRDLVLPDAPLSVALDTAGTGIFHGYPSGRVYRRDLETGEDRLVGDVLMQAQQMLALTSRFLLVGGPGSYGGTAFKVVSIDNGQVTGSRSPFYAMAFLAYSAPARTIYAHHTNVSPTDIHYTKFDEATGALTADGDSPYHGDYALGYPLRLINGGTRVVAGSGAMFSCSQIVSTDLLYSGSLPYGFVDLAADDALGKLYLLNNAGIRKLVILDDTNYFTERTVDLPGTPVRVFDTANSVVVLSALDGRIYGKPYRKSSLGL
jgi:hypothetical protein